MQAKDMNFAFADQTKRVTLPSQCSWCCPAIIAAEQSGRRNEPFRMLRPIAAWCFICSNSVIGITAGLLRTASGMPILPTSISARPSAAASQFLFAQTDDEFTRTSGVTNTTPSRKTWRPVSCEQV
ncbi:MAG: hypothetical protein U5M23_08550 [Marinagarivorans sp.]|nr:hypothetical protein [Marinagarivorans sp.]